MKLQIRRHAVQLCAAVLYNANAFTPLTGRAVDFPYDKACVPGLNCQYCRYTVAGCPLGVTQQALERFRFCRGLAVLGDAGIVWPLIRPDDLRLGLSLWAGCRSC